MTPEVRDYVKQDRQWLRPLRIAHAKYQLAKSQRENDAARVLFWQAVLEANGANETDANRHRN